MIGRLRREESRERKLKRWDLQSSESSHAESKDAAETGGDLGGGAGELDWGRGRDGGAIGLDGAGGLALGAAAVSGGRHCGWGRGGGGGSAA